MEVALGIDIGGTNTVFGIVNRRGEILRQEQMQTTGYDTVAAYIDALSSRLRPLISTPEFERVVGIGVGAPNGNYYTGEVLNAVNLPWKGSIPLSRLLQDAMGLKTTITNDANAAALGEMIYGAAKGMKDFVMVTLGTGLGSGFVANGQLIYGHDGFAGELGHVTAVRGGRRCNCGRNGCLETYASATGVVKTARELLAESKEPSVLRDTSVALTSKSISEAATQGDPLALQVFNRTAEILGQCLADVVAITSPRPSFSSGAYPDQVSSCSIRCSDTWKPICSASIKTAFPCCSPCCRIQTPRYWEPAL
jgi:glucokinase